MSNISGIVKSIQNIMWQDTGLNDPIKKWWNKRTESDIAWKVNIKTIIERGYDLDIKNPTKPQEEKEYNSAELMDMLSASFEKSQTLLNHLKQTVK